MALQASFLVFADQTVAATSVAASNSTTITIGNNLIVAINATQDITITVGSATQLTTASATSFRLPANQTLEFDMGANHDRLSVFNIGTSSATVYVQPFSRF